MIFLYNTINKKQLKSYIILVDLLSVQLISSRNLLFLFDNCSLWGFTFA